MYNRCIMVFVHTKNFHKSNDNIYLHFSPLFAVQNEVIFLFKEI